MRLLWSLIFPLFFSQSLLAAQPFEVAPDSIQNYWGNYVGAVSTSKNFCTGTLVAKDLVLTAAHCLWNVDKEGGRYVRAVQASKSEMTFSLLKGGQFQPISVKEIFIGSGYPKNGAQDWAFLRLNSSVNYDSYPKISKTFSEDQILSRSLVYLGYPSMRGASASEIRALKVSKEVCDFKAYEDDYFVYGKSQTSVLLGMETFTNDEIYASSCKSRKGLSGSPIVDPDSKEIFAVQIKRIKTDYGQLYFYSNVLNLSISSPVLRDQFLDLKERPSH